MVKGFSFGQTWWQPGVAAVLETASSPVSGAVGQRAKRSPGSMPTEPTYGSMSQMRAAVRAQPGRRPRFSLKSWD
jgi:hypothetical protein